MSAYFPPEYGSTGFHCLYCEVKADQSWNTAYGSSDSGGFWQIKINDEPVEISFCSHCSKPTFWLSGKIIYPIARIFPSPNNDLNDEVKEVYNEAVAIGDKSPRAACALLRLAIEMLLRQLGETGNLNEGIKIWWQGGLIPKYSNH